MTTSSVHCLFEPAPEPPPATYQFVQNLLPFALSTFCVEDRSLVCRAVEVIYKASGNKIIPHYEQLNCLVQLQCQDITYVATTGSGKMLIIAMLLLLNPKLLALTVLLLKELQCGQVWAAHNLHQFFTDKLLGKRSRETRYQVTHIICQRDSSLNVILGGMLFLSFPASKKTYVIFQFSSLYFQVLSRISLFS